MLRNIVRKYTTAVTANPTVKPLARTAEQASNRAATWARSQQPKADAFVGPKFEQRNLSKQPNPMAAIELISEEPIHFVTERIAVCNGGGGALGHPKIYINLDKAGSHPCGYCMHCYHKTLYIECSPFYLPFIFIFRRYSI
jgi:NADH dehydrogenase (ubiquinone) Fe-S protein 6